MNEYRISDITVGMSEEFKRQISSEMMSKFLDISGDKNPLHCDSYYAKVKGFKDRVVYGLLTSMFISTLAGCYLPGKFCILQGIEVKLAKPVFIGDEISVSGTVSKVDYDLKYMEVKVKMKNQNDETVLRGQYKAGIIDG